MLPGLDDYVPISHLLRIISEHLQNIFKTQELLPEATIRKFWIVQSEGNREVAREVEFYNLDGDCNRSNKAYCKIYTPENQAV